MIANFIFTFGLPGCGKSTYINEKYQNYNKMSDYFTFFKDLTELNADKMVSLMIEKSRTNEASFIIEADALKPLFNEYTEEHPEKVHQKSVTLAKEMVLAFADMSGAVNVLMDGGGINNHYTYDIIKYVKAHGTENVQCICFDTPVEVCIDRVANRARKVPVSAILDKNIQMSKCFHRYQSIVDTIVKVNYFTNRYVFLDMDGTIVAHGKGRVDENGNVDFVNSEMFRYAKPVKHVIDFVRKHFPMENVFIVTACANNFVLEEKKAWLKDNFPEIPDQNMLWVGNKDWKHVFLQQFAKRMKFNVTDMTMIDDNHPNISKCIGVGMNAVHISNIEALFEDTSLIG